MTYVRKIFILRELDNAQISSVMMQLFKFQLELAKSKARIHYTLDPLDHYFGKTRINFQYEFQDINRFPLIMLNATLYQVENTINKLKKSPVFDPKMIKNIRSFMKEYTVQDKKGNRTLNIKFNPNRKDIIILNGAPRKWQGFKLPNYAFF
jgi:hypothetical protein